MATLPGDLRLCCVEERHVVVAVAHRAMRTLMVDLLARDRGRWAVKALDGMTDLEVAAASRPDLVVMDAADFERCCGEQSGAFPLDHIVVIGAEPDPTYRQVVLDQGAGAWLSRDHVAEQLGDALRLALGCRHGRGPPTAGVVIREGTVQLSVAEMERDAS